MQPQLIQHHLKGALTFGATSDQAHRRITIVTA